MHYWVLLFLLLLSPLQSLTAKENIWLRLQQHLFIGDYWQAYREYQSHSSPVLSKANQKKVVAEILVRIGLFEDAIALWEELYEETPE